MMIELVKDILEYNQTRDMGIWLSKHPWVVEDVESFGVMITDVLAWFRLGYKRELWKKDGKRVKQKPLEINLSYPWCNILKDITENDPQFLKYFYVSKNKFDFRETVAEEERIQAMEFVYNNDHVVPLYN